MDEYIIGSVADVISAWSTPKVKPKKSKLKLNNDDHCESTVTKPKKGNLTNNIPKVKTKNKLTPNDLSSKKLQLKFGTDDHTQSTVAKPKNETPTYNIPKGKTKNKSTSKELTPENTKLNLGTNNQSQIIVTKPKNENPTNHISKVKMKNKLTPTESSENNISKYTGQFNTTESHTESFNTKIKKKSKAQKRKKSVTSNDEEILKQKRPKSGAFEENQIPSISENENIEKLGKNSKENEEVPKKYKETLNENTVFVGNIPINYDKKKICRAFSKFGEIQNARIRCIPVGDINVSKKVAAIKKNFNPKRNSLVAFINFKSLNSATAAVEASGMILDGHHIRVDFADNNKEKDNNKAVFVGGLPFDIEDDELWEFFQNCGSIKSVRIIRDSQTSMGKGFGYLNFESTAAVELALQLNGQELKKRVINVKRCVNWKKKKNLNSFGRQKSKEMANQLLCKRGKKFKEEKKKLKKEKKKFSSDFQGRTANMKQKKKKKLSKAVLRQRRIVKILETS